jgi:hypothetical protein
MPPDVGGDTDRGQDGEDDEDGQVLSMVVLSWLRCWG